MIFLRLAILGEIAAINRPDDASTQAGGVSGIVAPVLEALVGRAVTIETAAEGADPQLAPAVLIGLTPGEPPNRLSGES